MTAFIGDIGGMTLGGIYSVYFFIPPRDTPTTGGGRSGAVQADFLGIELSINYIINILYIIEI